VMRHCGVRSKHGRCAWRSASGSAGRGWRWRANSRLYCTPCGATGRYSSGGVPRHRHKSRQHRPRLSSSYCRPRPETAVKFSREGGTGWDASEATRLVRAARRATPTTRMAPSRSNFPYPAPITASKREEKAVTSGRGIWCTVLRSRCHAHLTRCRNERRRGRPATGCIARSRLSGTLAWWSPRR